MQIVNEPIDVSLEESHRAHLPAALAPEPRWGAQRIVWGLIRLAVGLGLIAYLIHSKIIDLQDLSRLVTAWPISLAALALMFLDIVLMAVRLSWLFRAPGLRLSFRNSLELNLVSSFFATFLPGAAGGDVAKLFYATAENKGRRAEIVTVVVFDRAVGLFSILILPLFFVPFYVPLLHSVPVLGALLTISLALALGMLVVFLICLFYPTVAARWTQALPRLSRIVERIAQTIAAYHHAPRTLLAALALSLVANLTLIAITALAILALHPVSFSMKMALVVPLGDLANNLPITPGGLGVGESAYNALFRAVGLEGGAEALLCWRIWRAAVGLIGLFLYLRGLGRAVYEGNSASGKETVP